MIVTDATLKECDFIIAELTAKKSRQAGELSPYEQGLLDGYSMVRHRILQNESRSEGEG